jgi:hypothetical protein
MIAQALGHDVSKHDFRGHNLHLYSAKEIFDVAQRYLSSKDCNHASYYAVVRLVLVYTAA